MFVRLQSTGDRLLDGECLVRVLWPGSLLVVLTSNIICAMHRQYCAAA